MRELFIGLPVARVVGPVSRVDLGALLARKAKTKCAGPGYKRSLLF
jgi:hypothetical protein